jgi:pyridoxamine 5'-phosphate oxidase
MSDKPLSIQHLRRDYASRALDEATIDPDPLRQFRLWFDEAVQADALDANAVAIATVRPDGVPAVRTVLLKDIDARGLVFFTHYNSPKGEDLAHTPYASLLHYWPELERQVRATGPVERVLDAESDAYFASRPRDSQIAAWAARQSSELPDRATLERRYAEIKAKFEGDSVPRPPEWGGYRVIPNRFEFWQGRPGRLHDRLLYTRSEDGSWKRVRLAP